MNPLPPFPRIVYICPNLYTEVVNMGRIVFRESCLSVLYAVGRRSIS